ncbi:hypothetical protein J2766_001057 [Agrobacterium tumefaciens]|uniref:Uncharacterized protein n=1 Tax=Agrobacterium tumefaciens TaxID=358 RepID=A0AAW8LSJ8_AGRTU|nr:hypothetical protein [Agrobacterium tumefaciens]MDR6701637.1 hypothetical protein [Agrobacterium tumefaciens]
MFHIFLNGKPTGHIFQLREVAWAMARDLERECGGKATVRALE